MTEIIRLSDQDITALEKIEKDAEEFSEKKLELYNDYRRMLSELCVRYIEESADMTEIIELSSIDIEKRDKCLMYVGTPFIEHEIRNAWYAVRTKKIEDAKAFFGKPLGIFNVCDFKEFCSILNGTLNIVGVVPVDVAKHIVEVGNDSGKQIHFRLHNVSGLTRRYRCDFRILILQANGDHFTGLVAIARKVYCA